MLSYEYIRGIIDRDGCFTFCSAPPRRGMKAPRARIPTFIIAMEEKDLNLLQKLKEALKVRGTIYKLGGKVSSDGYKRTGMNSIMVRDFGQLKNIIVPLCHKKLHGYKASQFENWIEIMSCDDSVPKLYKLIPTLVHSGFYDKDPNFL